MTTSEKTSKQAALPMGTTPASDAGTVTINVSEACAKIIREHAAYRAAFGETADLDAALHDLITTGASVTAWARANLSICTSTRAAAKPAAKPESENGRRTRIRASVASGLRKILAARGESFVTHCHDNALIRVVDKDATKEEIGGFLASMAREYRNTPSGDVMVESLGEIPLGGEIRERVGYRVSKRAT